MNEDPTQVPVDDRTPMDEARDLEALEVVGSSTKGYSAEPGPQPDVPDDGPVPLAEVPDPMAPILVPERDNHVVPTGRDEPGDYTPNDRLMGADR